MSEPETPIIVTRAEPGASQTAARLREMGFNPILSPVLDLTRSEAVLPALDAVAGLVFTSANGVRYFAEASGERTLPAWCVGPATASEALREGFTTVHQSSGDAHDLAHYIAHHAPTDGAKRLLHVANAAAKGNLKQALEAEGFEVIFAPLYEARPAPALSEAARNAISGSARTICLIHSAKGAEAFLALAKNLDLSKTIFVTISDQAAAPLDGTGAASLHAASHPDEDHLLDLLQRVHRGA